MNSRRQAYAIATSLLASGRLHALLEADRGSDDVLAEATEEPQAAPPPKPEPEVNNSRQARRWRARQEFKRLPRKA
tara:strand:+ start:13646 stop:13873 length:228 start_codon:yes stop_codon:yes gene_type:complete